MFDTIFNAEDHSFYFYLLIGVLIFGILQAIGIGCLFFLKRSGDRRANGFFGLLLITFGLTVFHYVLWFLDVFILYPRLYFLPVYFTLSFPVLLFYHVKLSMYPGYQLRSTDIKHFVLPLGQFVFFLCLFFAPVSYKETIGRWFYNPFYGAFEQFIYLFSFYAYMYFAWRYVHQKKGHIQNKAEGKKVWYATKLLQVLFVLFFVHTLFVIGDFISFEFLHINLQSLKTFTALGVLSFVILLYWLGIYGFQVLLWGRKLFAT
ncbi:MAG: hypothetical protein HRU40_05970 [Saprospiraceae bacterium]|nr:hypothetical protein [Saprospiraceae bacterium]